MNEFNVVKMIQIPKDYLRKRVLRELEGREAFTDADVLCDESIYYGNVLEAIMCEQSMIPNNSILKLNKKSLEQIELLNEEVKDYEYIQIIE